MWPTKKSNSNSAHDPCGRSGACVVAVDPGRSKCGVAVVRRDGGIAFRSVICTNILADEVNRLVATYRPGLIVVGDGTGGAAAVATIRDASPDIPVSTVDESYTSEEARKRYLAEERPRGFQRLLPPSLRTPPNPYDDYVAVILGERYWNMINA